LSKNFKKKRNCKSLKPKTLISNEQRDKYPNLCVVKKHLKLLSTKLA